MDAQQHGFRLVEGYRVVLASNSPRRKELLGGLGIDFEVRTLSDIDESYPDTLRGEEIPMYMELSGHAHEVITGVSIVTKRKTVQFASTSKVYFAELTDEEIAYYVDTYQPFDKAGAYGIQEWIGYVAVTRIEGSYFNVMGLPIQRLYTELKKYGNLHSRT